jgi:hypothetical protein
MEQLFPLWSVLALVGVLLIGGLLEHRGKRRETRPLVRAVASIRTNTLAFSAAAVVLLFSLPSMPVLSSFEYPKTLQQISEPARMLELLQAYNRAIVRTTEVLWLFILLFVSVLVGSTMSIISIARATEALSGMMPQPSSGAESGAGSGVS